MLRYLRLRQPLLKVGGGASDATTLHDDEDDHEDDHDDDDDDDEESQIDEDVDDEVQ